MTPALSHAAYRKAASDQPIDRKGIPAPFGKDPNLHDWGGAILTRPTLTNLYLGDYFESAQGQSDVEHNEAFSKEFKSSGMSNVVRQYRFAGLPEYQGMAVVPGESPERMTQADVEVLIRRQIAAGTVKPGPQAVVNVVLPPKTVLVSSDGTTSTQGMGGFHGSLRNGSDAPIYYSVIAYGDQTNGANLDGNPQDNISIVESHEWCEIATDPDVASPDPNRMVAFIDTQWGEIGDVGVYLLRRDEVWTWDAAGFAVQREWSNDDKLFEIDAGPWHPLT